MDFTNQIPNPHDPKNWPYGLPLDPKYLYQGYSKPGRIGYGVGQTEAAYSAQSNNPEGGLGIESLLSQ